MTQTSELKRKPTPEELRDDGFLQFQESLKDLKAGRIKKVKRIIE